MPFLKKKETILYSRIKEIEEKAKRNGLRHTIFNSLKERYIGEWKNDCKSGLGVIYAKNNIKYEGYMKDNHPHGFGILSKYENGKYIVLYRGEWCNGNKRGFGVRFGEDGSCYQGHYKNGKRHGYGQMWYADGSYYDGNWNADQRSGKGIWLNPSGDKRYEGQWLEDKKHGKGRYFHIDKGQMHEGIWRQDLGIFNTMSDLPYRQTAIHPTPYPIMSVKLVFPNIKLKYNLFLILLQGGLCNSEDLIKKFEANARQNQIENCLKDFT